MSNLIPIEDMNYLTQQSGNKLNLIISGMASLMNDTENKVTAMESQNWFQRMTKTLFGKNKATKEEIRRNTDKLNSYMTEALSELYNRNLIDKKIIMSLGIQLNELYKEHLQLKQMMGAFVDKLNKKIERIDNYHLLIKEIELGEFSKEAPIVELCKIMSQLDKTTIQDDRKMGILKKELIQYNVVTEEEVLLIDYLKSLLEIPMDEVGAIYLELQTMKDNFMAALAISMIEKYHFLPEMTKKLKNKNKIIEEVIVEQRLDENVALGTEYIFDEFVNSKLGVYENFLNFNQIEYSEEKKKTDVQEVDYVEENDEEILKRAYDLYNSEKFEEAFDLYKELANKENAIAQNYIGLMYFNGKGMEEDEDKAFEWFLKSAEQGHAAAQNNVGYCYKNGFGTYKDEDEAFNWYLKSAEQDYMEGQSNVAFCYTDGSGTKKDIEKAIYWISKALKKDKNNKQNKKLLEVCNETKKVVEDLFETALDFERSYSRFEANKIYREILELNIGYPKIEKMAKERLESN
jgi:tetratricopeptide repeat protein